MFRWVMLNVKLVQYADVGMLRDTNGFTAMSWTKWRERGGFSGIKTLEQNLRR